MKASMDSQGVITLHAETDVEAFALKQWCAMAAKTYSVDFPMALSRGSEKAWSFEKLVIDASGPKDQK